MPIEGERGADSITAHHWERKAIGEPNLVVCIFSHPGQRLHFVFTREFQDVVRLGPYASFTRSAALLNSISLPRRVANSPTTRVVVRIGGSTTGQSCMARL